MTTEKKTRFRVAVVSTGGTIDKTYCAQDGALRNDGSVLDLLLGNLQTPSLEIERVSLFDKDSLDMSEEDHDAVANAVEDLARGTDGVVVVHGTDRLAVTGERIHDRLQAVGGSRVPVVLTGAMRPFELRTSDATQNVTEALLSVQLLDPGVYCVMHGRVLAFPGVVKDAAQGTFVRPRD